MCYTGDDRWGHCSPDCKGEKAEPDSKYNLALDMYTTTVWEQNLYDLALYGAGYCFTYNPPQTSQFEFQNRLFMLLGNKKLKTVQNNPMREFYVYLHEKGQFWPRPGMNMIGQSEGIRLGTKMEIIGQFQYGKLEMINKDDTCTHDKDYSFTRCILNFIERETRCVINWNEPTSDKDTCSQNIDLRKYKDLFDFIKLSSSSNLSQVTGCKPKCKQTTYKYIEEEKGPLNNSQWVSSMYLLPQEATTTHVTEKYEFGLSNLIADFGSYIGLFLGWSFLSMSSDIPVWIVWATRILRKESK